VAGPTTPRPKPFVFRFVFFIVGHAVVTCRIFCTANLLVTRSSLPQFTADHWSYFMSNALFGSSRIVGIAAAYANQVTLVDVCPTAHPYLPGIARSNTQLQDAFNRVKDFFDSHPVDGMQGSYKRCVSLFRQTIRVSRDVPAKFQSSWPHCREFGVGANSQRGVCDRGTACS
jgi:hypothetical protein